ncbi:MAG: FkbM family methyltransferase [Gammaproteobacteria bacterium]|nr:FkbM family methyltransferase [Gammaproteobacteria bacterium]
MKIGMGSEAGEFAIYTFSGLAHGHASASDLGRDDAQPHRCRVSTLDSYTSEQSVSRVDFMKIDTEGHELSVLQGGKALLSGEGAPLVYFEVNQQCITHRGIDPNAIIELLRGCGYETFLSFAVRTGVQSVKGSIPTASADYLAFRPEHGDRLAAARSVDRIWRRCRQ